MYTTGIRVRSISLSQTTRVIIQITGTPTSSWTVSRVQKKYNTFLCCVHLQSSSQTPRVSHSCLSLCCPVWRAVAVTPSQPRRLTSQLAVSQLASQPRWHCLMWHAAGSGA